MQIPITHHVTGTWGPASTRSGDRDRSSESLHWEHGIKSFFCPDVTRSGAFRRRCFFVYLR